MPKKTSKPKRVVEAAAEVAWLRPPNDPARTVAVVARGPARNVRVFGGHYRKEAATPGKGAVPG